MDTSDPKWLSTNRWYKLAEQNKWVYATLFLWVLQSLVELVIVAGRAEPRGQGPIIAELLVQLIDGYILTVILTLPVVCIAFGIFYAKSESRSMAFGVFMGLIGFGLYRAAIYFVPYGAWKSLPVVLFVMAVASLYVAQKKNRGIVWTILTMLLGPPVLLVLLSIRTHQPETPPISLE